MIAVPRCDALRESLNFEELRKRCLGRLDLVDKVLTDFEKFLGTQLGELEDAVTAGDLPKTRALSHRLKGASLTVSARGVSDCAHQLESLSAGSSMPEIQSCLSELRVECDRLATAIKQCRSER